MVSRLFRPSDPLAAERRLCRHRLVVLGSGIGDLVEGAGGFLCDQARAGWDVTVLRTDFGDTRPLAILGLTEGDPVTDARAAVRELARGGVLVLGADLLAGDIRDDVACAADDPLREIIVWGRPPRAEVGHGLEPVLHPMSTAARAFKAHALRAAGRPAAPGTAEALFRIRAGSFRRLYPV